MANLPVATASVLRPVPALGNYLSEEHTNNVIQIHDGVKSAGVTWGQFVIRSVAELALGVALLALGILSIYTGVGALGVAAGIALITDSFHNAYKAYHEYNRSILNVATHALVERSVRGLDVNGANGRNGGINDPQVRQIVANILADREQQQAQPAAARPAAAQAPVNAAALFGAQLPQGGQQRFGF